MERSSSVVQEFARLYASYQGEADRESRNAQRIVEAIIALYLPFVRTVIKRYTCDPDLTEVLLVTGKLALCRALQSWNSERGVTFLTYAGHFVKRSVRDAYFDEQRAIGHSRYYRTHRNKIIKASAVFMAVNGREPNLTELVALTGLTIGQLNAILEPPPVCRLLSEFQGSDKPLDFDSLLAVNLKQAESKGGVEAEVLRRLQHEEIVKLARQHLPPTQLEVVVALHGLDGQAPITVAELARKLGIKQQSVASRYQFALGRLRRLLVEL